MSAHTNLGDSCENCQHRFPYDDCVQCGEPWPCTTHRLAEAIKDVCWKATVLSTDEDGAVRSYVVPAGALNRLLGAAQGAGSSAAFRDESFDVKDEEPPRLNENSLAMQIAKAIMDWDQNETGEYCKWDSLSEDAQKSYLTVAGEVCHLTQRAQRELFRDDLDVLGAAIDDLDAIEARGVAWCSPEGFAALIAELQKWRALAAVEANSPTAAEQHATRLERMQWLQDALNAADEVVNQVLCARLDNERIAMAVGRYEILRHDDTRHFLEQEQTAMSALRHRIGFLLFPCAVSLVRPIALARTAACRVVAHTRREVGMRRADDLAH